MTTSNSRNDQGGLGEIQRRFIEMLDDGRHAFDAAANALLGGTDPEAIRSDLFATDRRINRTEQELRRKLVVHGAVHGASHLPQLLVLMSLAKDAERIGDYAKNLFDLAVERPWLGDDEERKELIELKDRISRALVRAKGNYELEDVEAARTFLAECHTLEDLCDDRIDRAVRVQGQNAAGLALACRYFKRVVSHASNVITSLVMPLDKLDFYDES
ncbi:MAG: PhoU domain-containing protein [Planctomycetota bacterium]